MIVRDPFTLRSYFKADRKIKHLSNISKLLLVAIEEFLVAVDDVEFFAIRS